MDLTPVAGRVIGALIEKQLTTPQQYPLTLNALLAACNQTSSRNPIVSYDERLVDTTLAGLKSRGFVRFVHPSHGRSATRYRQVIEEVLHLDATELALLAVLLLRGPQTLGELRGRTERMADLSLQQVQEQLDGLADRPEPLVTRLEREPGRKEERWAQRLAGEIDPGYSPTGQPVGAGSGSGFGAGSGDEPAGDRWQQPAERYAPAAQEPAARPVAEAGPSLASQVAVLRAEVAALRRDLDDLIHRLGS